MRRLVLIEWVDSTGSLSGWHPVEEQRRDKAGVIYTAGYFIFDGRECKRVAAGYYEADEDLGTVESASGIITIPVRCILRQVDLVEVAARDDRGVSQSTALGMGI